MCFSVVVPVYNAAATIGASVASVFAQTEGRFEILLIDDGSSDDSLKVAMELAELDQRIRVISVKNSGASAARNLGMQLSKGEYIAFLDADDIWAPTKLERHLQLHRKPAGHRRKLCADRLFGYRRRSGSAHDFNDCPRRVVTVKLIGENPICTMSNFVIARSNWNSFGRFREDMTHAEDQEWLARAVSGGALIEGD